MNELIEQNKRIYNDYIKLKNSIVNAVNAFKTNDESLEKFIQDLAELEYEVLNTNTNNDKHNTSFGASKEKNGLLTTEMFYDYNATEVKKSVN